MAAPESSSPKYRRIADALKRAIAEGSSGPETGCPGRTS